MVSEDKPTVSVVMSVYNGQTYLPTAIESILSQTFVDFEFIIVDDGSTDSSLEIIRGYEARDDRVRIILNEKNIGLAKSLNKGIALAQGRFIARMDADDISLPNRFEKQIEYLENNPEIFVLGGSVVSIDDEGRLGKLSAYPLRPQQVKWLLFFGHHLAHPTSMFRTELFLTLGIKYNENLKTTQDFDIWVQIAERFAIANLPDVLLYYRDHEDNVSHKSSEIQRKTNLQIRQKLICDTLKKNIPMDVVSTCKKPFSSQRISTVLRSIFLVLSLERKSHLSELDQIDQEFIKQDINYRIGKMIQQSKIKFLLYPYQLIYHIFHKT